MPWNSAMLASTPRSCLAVDCIAYAQEGGRAGTHIRSTDRNLPGPHHSIGHRTARPMSMQHVAIPALTGSWVPAKCPPHTSQLCCKWLVATDAHLMHRRSCSW